MPGPWRTFAALPLLFAVLAGCAGAPAGPGAGNDAGDGQDPAAVNATMHAAPRWDVGQFWVHDWTIGSATQFTVKSIVVDNTSGEYVLATDDEDMALYAASFFFGDIGRMSKSDWTVRDADYSMPWYDFPLEDGKTWTGTEENLDAELNTVSRTLTMTATAAPDHRFLIEATSDGLPRARYDYDPSIGWFTKYESLASDANGTRTVLSITTTSSGQGFTGRYYQATAEMVLNELQLISPPGQAVQPAPSKQFNVEASATHVHAILFAFAAPGASHTELAAPDGQHWEATAVADHTGHNVQGNGGLQVLVPAVPGQWTFATAGAGGFAWGGGAFAWALTLTNGTVPPPMR